MKLSAWVLLFLSLGAFFVVRAQDGDEDDYTPEDDEVEEEYEDEIDAHEVSTNFLLPEYADKRFPVGKEVTILVDVSNNGQDVFNITRIGAYLHSPYDLNYYIQNFTVKALSGVAAPSAQVSLEYKFVPDAKLEPLEFWFSGFVEYTMEGSDEAFQQVFVNSTVHLFDDKNGLDIVSAFNTFLMVAVLGTAAYFIFKSVAEKSGLQKKKTKFVPKPAAEKVDDWESDIYKPKDSSKVIRRKRVSKK